MNTTLDTRHCPLGHPGTDEPQETPFDAYVCRTCTGALRGLLTDLADTMDDLDAAIGRQLRFTTKNGTARDAETPVPVNLAASNNAWAARQTILVHVGEVAAIRGHTAPQSWESIGTYLAESANWMARHPNAEEWFGALLYALREAKRTVDRPADKIYAGICNGNTLDADGLCTQALYARPGAATVTCPVCGTEWPVHDRRRHMLDRVEGMHLPAPDLTKAVNGLLNTTVVQAHTIRQWRKRGHIEPTGINGKGQPVYSVATVLARALGKDDDAA